jgi:hypothetical protein
MLEPWCQFSLEEMEVPDTAAELLAATLRSGSLMLLLGAGVSAMMGLPSWAELVTRLSAVAGLDSTDLLGRSGGDFLEAVDVIKRSFVGDFQAALAEALYRDVMPRQGTDEAVYLERLLSGSSLMAIGALCMGSQRGSVSEVINLNFDDILETYLTIHGFVARVVTDLPSIAEVAADVTVYHIHGYLPSDPGQRGTSLVLSADEYETRLAEDVSSPWNAFLLERLHSRVFLSVGTSMRDIDMRVALKRAAKEVGDTRPLGFVLGMHDEDDVARLRSRHLVPVSLGSWSEVTPFLLRICRYAAVPF